MSGDKQKQLAEDMKAGMRRMAASVCVVTALDASSKRFAMTASSVTSVSDQPASLLVCVNQIAGIDSAIKDSGMFAINVLSANQVNISNLCAQADPPKDRFDEGQWRQHPGSGLYLLKDSQVSFICRQTKVLPYGTHNVYIADIEHVELGSGSVDPLVYLDGAYRSANTAI